MLHRRDFIILASLLIPKFAFSASLSLDEISTIGLKAGFDAHRLEHLISNEYWNRYLSKEYKDLQPYPDQLAQLSIHEIAKPLFATSTRKNLRWRISLNTTNQINACTVGGGVIFINLGLIKACNSETELASVIAHEIGHVEHMHSIKRILSEAILKQYQLDIDLKKIGQQPQHAMPSFNNIMRCINEILYQSYFRLNEFEADAFILRAFLQAGFPLDQASTFFKTLLKMEKGRPHGACLFSTHPETRERIQRLDSLAATYNSNPVHKDSEAFKYLKTL